MDNTNQDVAKENYRILNLIFKTLNENKTFLITFGALLTAAAPFLFQFTFPDLVFEEPGYVEVLMLGTIAIILVLGIMLVPALLGYIFIYVKKKKRQGKNVGNIVRSKRTKILVLEFYLPLFLFVALIPLSLYIEFNDCNSNISIVLYLLIIFLYPFLKILLKKRRIFTLTKNESKKTDKLLYILNRIFVVEASSLVTLSLIPLFIIFFVIQLNEKSNYPFVDTYYLLKIFLSSLLFLLPSTIFLYKPGKPALLFSLIIGIYIIIFFVRLYNPIISPALGKKHIANYYESLIFNEKSCKLFKAAGVQIDEYDDHSCMILDNYLIKNNLGKDQIVLTITNDPLSNIDITLKKNQIRSHMNLTITLPKQEELDRLVTSFAIINRLKNFSISVRSASKKDFIYSSYNTENKTRNLILGNKHRGLQLGLLQMLIPNMISLDDNARDYFPEAEKQSFSELLSQVNSENIFYPLVNLLASSLELEPRQIYKRTFSSMRLIDPETQLEELSINLNDLSHLFSYLNNDQKMMEKLIKIGYFMKSTLGGRRVNILTSDYRRNHVMVIYNVSNHCTIALSVVDDAFDMKLSNPKILHILEGFMNLKT